MGELVRHRQGRAHVYTGPGSRAKTYARQASLQGGQEYCTSDAAPTCRRADRHGLLDDKKMIQYGPAVPLARAAGSVTCRERAGEAEGKHARTACPTESKVGLVVYLLHASELPVRALLVASPSPPSFCRVRRSPSVLKRERASAARYMHFAAPVLKCSSAAFSFSLGFLVWSGRAAPRARECGRWGRRS